MVASVPWQRLGLQLGAVDLLNVLRRERRSGIHAATEQGAEAPQILLYSAVTTLDTAEFDPPFYSVKFVGGGSPSAPRPGKK